MSYRDQEAHLRGQRHAEGLRTVAQGDGETESIESPSPTAEASPGYAIPLQTSSPPTKVQQWTCTICNLTMPMMSQNAHLYGRCHARGLSLRNSQMNLNNATAMTSTPTAGPSMAFLGTMMAQKLLLREYGTSVGGGSSSQSASAVERFWTCTTCNITITALGQGPHLRGKPHAKKLSMLNSQMNAVLAAPPAPPAPPTPTSNPAAVQHWTCTVCNLKMGASSKISHLRGKPHAKKLKMPDPQNTSMTAVPSSSTTPAPKTATSWTCLTCKLTMSTKDQQMHLRGQRHKNKLGVATSKVAASKQAATKSSSSPAEKTWTCTTCAQKMPEKSKRSHLGSASHKTLLRMLGDELNDQYDELDDQYEARLLAYNIDTQWGMLPHGGAYKESDVFYPEENSDFYW